MKKISKLILSTTLAFVLALMGFSNVSALTLREGAEAARCDDCPTNLFGETGVIRQISNTLIFIIGIIAVIMLIWGGLRYVVSGGDAKKVTDAKNTILYAIIGLIISFMAFAIVGFVVDALPSNQPEEEKEESTSLVLPRSIDC